MPRSPLLVSLLLLLPTTSGCGLWMHTPTPASPAWPVRLVGDQRGPQRPTVLVRRRVIDDAGEVIDGSLTMSEELPGLPEESGLFARVNHQPGLEGYTVDADYTLDLALERDFDFGWYSVLGIIPGIPLVAKEDFKLTLIVRDAQHDRLETIRVRRSKVLAVSLACLPFNLVFSVLPGDLGFDVVAMIEEQERMVEGMIQEALFRADQAVRFSAPVGGTVTTAHPTPERE